MELSKAIIEWVDNQTREDPDHAWFITAHKEVALQLVDQKCVNYEGHSFLVGLNPLDRTIGYAYDHEYLGRIQTALEGLQKQNAAVSTGLDLGLLGELRGGL